MNSLSKQAYICFGLFMAAFMALIVAWQDTAVHLFDLVTTVDTFSHGQIIPFISLWLVWERMHLLKAKNTYVWPPGVLFLMLACLLWYVGVLIEAKLIEHLALISAIQSLILLFFGPVNYQRLLFPCLFLYLTVPFGHALVPVMQAATADMVVSVLGIIGVSHEANGLYITLQSGVYEVARACAGVRFLLTSIVTGILLAHLVTHQWKKRIYIMLLAVVVPIFANVVRVLGILLISEVTDQSFARDVDHIIYGWVFLSAVLILLITMAYRFADDSKPYQGNIFFNFRQPLGLATACIAALLAFSIPFLSANFAPDKEVEKVPVGLFVTPVCQDCGVRSLTDVSDRHLAGLVGVTARYTVGYRIDADQISVSAALYCPRLSGTQFNHQLEALFLNGWIPDTSLAPQFISYAGWRFEKQYLVKRNRTKIVWSSYYIGSESVASSFDVKMSTILQRLKYGASAGVSLVVSMPDFGTDDAGQRAFTKLFSTFPPDSFLWDEIKPTAEGPNICVG